MIVEPAVFDRVEVSKGEVRISRSEAALAGAIAAQEKSCSDGVPGFVREWWAYNGVDGHWETII